MQTAFVLGFVIQIAGGVLLAFSVLTLDRHTLASRGATFPSPGGAQESQVEPARGIAGLILLVSGILIQLAAQIGDRWELWPVAVAVGVVTFCLGWFVGTKVIAPWLHRRGSSAAS